jgi:hypothetical protein
MLKLHFKKDIQYQPWDKIYLDIVGPLQITDEGHKYILMSQNNE